MLSFFSFKNALFITIFSLLSFSINAQDIKEPRTIADWSRDYEPYRIVGNLYYVGTYDLGCYLVTTNKGNILINTGLGASAPQIKKNIETLGFKFSDTKILLTTQAHYDHVGAMAAIKKMTGAQLWADEKDADVLTSGGSSDYELGAAGRSFEPVNADKLLHDHDTITLGDMKLVILHHPGHTKGSCSYMLTVKDEQKSYKVLIANMPTIVTEKKLNDIPAYPGIANDFAYTFASLKKLSFDIWIASHAGQFHMHDKHKPGDAYNPSAFIDRPGYETAVNDLQKIYDRKMEQARN